MSPTKDPNSSTESRIAPLMSKYKSESNYTCEESESVEIVSREPPLIIEVIQCILYDNCCTYICPHFSPYLIHVSRCFHVKFRWEMVKFTSFESCHAYNVFCLTFWRNIWILIERKTLGMISRKNRSHNCATRVHYRAAGSKVVHGCMHNRASYQCV